MVIAQIVRVAAAIFCIIADHSNNRKKMLVFNAIYNFLNGVHYALLNAITGAISSLITVLRNVIFYVFKKRVPVAVLLAYFIIVILININSVTSLVAVIPVFLVIIYSTALYIGNLWGIKIAVIITCSLEIVYNIYVGAYVGIAACVIDIIFVIISMRKLKNSQKNVKIKHKRKSKNVRKRRK